MYWSYTFSICLAPRILSFKVSRFVFRLSMFSIASDIGRRSSSDKVWRELLRISLITVGLKSLESFGVRSWIRRSSSSLYSSWVSNPKRSRFTHWAYSAWVSMTFPPSPIWFFSSRIVQVILLCRSLYSQKSFPTLLPSVIQKYQESSFLFLLARMPIPKVRYSPLSFRFSSI